VGSGRGQYRFPYGLDQDREGNLVVCEFGNNRVQLIDKHTGKGLKIWGSEGRAPGHFAYPWAVAVDKRGRVVAVDRSRRFLGALDAMRRQRGIENVTTHELDLAEDPLPAAGADGAWCRWVLCFVPRPRDLLVRIRDSLRPGARFVSHEYFDYGTWRLAPRCLPQEEFVAAVTRSWRATGGEPDIALDLPGWLEELGFRIESLRPIVDVVSPSSYVWQWPSSFVASGLRRFVELGEISPSRAAAIADAIAEAERTPHTRMITPSVLEIVALRR
jgi:SAM-dependent methyltransferase